MTSTNDIEYRVATRDDYPAIRRLLADLGWGDRVNDVERFHAMLDRADRTVVALDHGEVVGFARALTDGVSNGYIGTVAVAADRRRRGIGRALVEHLTADDPAGSITWVLRAGRGSRPFWEALGFGASAVAMERVRRR